MITNIAGILQQEMCLLQSMGWQRWYFLFCFLKSLFLFKVADFGLARDLEGGNYYRKVPGVRISIFFCNAQRWVRPGCQCCGWAQKAFLRVSAPPSPMSGPLGCSYGRWLRVIFSTNIVHRLSLFLFSWNDLLFLPSLICFSSPTFFINLWFWPSSSSFHPLPFPSYLPCKFFSPPSVSYLS